VQVCKMVSEERTRDVQYTVCVPQQQTRTFNVTEYRRVAEQKTVQDTVMVPYTEQREVEVRVCKMVPQTVMVPENGHHDGHGHNGHGHHGRRGIFGWR
jgi:hypothetical protein